MKVSHSAAAGWPNLVMSSPRREPGASVCQRAHMHFDKNKKPNRNATHIVGAQADGDYRKKNPRRGGVGCWNQFLNGLGREF